MGLRLRSRKLHLLCVWITLSLTLNACGGMMHDLKTAGGAEQVEAGISPPEGPSRRQAGDAGELSDDVGPSDLQPDAAIDCGGSDCSGGGDGGDGGGDDGGGDDGGGGGDGGGDDGDGGDGGGDDGDGGQGATGGLRGGPVTDQVLRRFLTQLLGDPGESLRAVRLQGAEGGGVAVAPVQMDQGHMLSTPAPLVYTPSRAQGRQRQAATLSGVVAVDGEEWDLLVVLKSRAPWGLGLHENFGWVGQGGEPPTGPLQPMAPRASRDAWRLSGRTPR